MDMGSLVKSEVIDELGLEHLIVILREVWDVLGVVFRLELDTNCLLVEKVLDNGIGLVL